MSKSSEATKCYKTENDSSKSNWQQTLKKNGEYLTSCIIDYGVQWVKQNTRSTSHTPINDGRANWMSDIHNPTRVNPSNVYSTVGYQNTYYNGNAQSRYSDTVQAAVPYSDTIKKPIPYSDTKNQTSTRSFYSDEEGSDSEQVVRKVKKKKKKAKKKTKKETSVDLITFDKVNKDQQDDDLLLKF